MKTAGRCVAFLISILILLTSGCNPKASVTPDKPGSGTGTSAGSAQELRKANIQVALWSLGYQKGLENAIAKFNAINIKDIHIELLQIPRFKYTEILNMLMTSGDGPDIFGINNEWLNTYMNRNWALDISKYIDNEFLSAFPGWAVNFARDPVFRGGFYTIPATMVTTRLIYNKDLFEMAGLDAGKPPLTIDELEEYAVKISAAGIGNSKFGFALPLGEDWAGFVQSMEMPFTCSGIYYYDFNKGMYDLKVYDKWLRTIQDMKKNGALYPGENTMKIDALRAQFAEGNIGMMFASSWDPAVLQNQYSTNCRWGVAMPPALDEQSVGKGKAIVLPGVCYVVNPDSPDKEKVMKVWKYLYSKDCLGEQFRLGGEIPVPGGIISDPEYEPETENYGSFLPGENDSPYPDTPTGGSEWDRFDTYMQAYSDSGSAAYALEYETAKLNEAFWNKVYTKVFDIRDYMDESFDAKNPLK